MWKCSCGEENDSSMKFCPSCGSRTTEDDDNSPEEVLDTTPDETSEEPDDGDDTNADDADSIVVVRSSAKWTCSCGKSNPGRAGICRACGKSSYDSSSLSAPTLEAPKTEAIPKESKFGFFPSFADDSRVTFSSPAPVTPPAPVAYVPVSYAYAPPATPISPIPPTSSTLEDDNGWTCTCGAYNEEESNFCSVCGHPKITPFESEEKATVEAVETAKTAPEAAKTDAEDIVTETVTKPKEEIRLPMTTSQGFEGRTITEYIDVVCGTNFYTTGGIANSLQYSYSFEQAKKDLSEKAQKLGADAVIAVQTTVFSPQETDVIVSVSGTAVKLDKKEHTEETIK